MLCSSRNDDFTMTIGSKIVSGVAWSAVETWARQAAALAIFVVLARQLDPSAFGLAALAMVTPILFAAPVTKGIPDAIVQRADLEPIHLDSAFWLLTTVGLLSTAVIFFLSHFIASAFGQPALEELVKATSVIVAVQAVASVPAAILKRELNFRLFALRTLAGTVLGGAVGIAMAIAGFGVWSLVWMQIIKAVGESVVILAGANWRPHFRYSHSRCRELFGFSGPIVIQFLWTYINDEMPRVFIGMFLGPHAVGIYTIARRPFDLLVEVFVGPLTAVALPAVSRLQGDTARIDKFFDQSIRTAGLFGVPAFAGFAALAPVAIPFVFGEQWTGAIVAVQLFMLIGMLRTIDGICAFTILALGRSGLLLALNISYTVMAALLLTVTVRAGLYATVTTLVVCNALLLPVLLYFVAHFAHVNVMKPLRFLPRVVLASSIMFGAVYYALANLPPNTPAILQISAGILIGVVTYMIAAVILLRPELLVARDTLLKLRT